MTRGNENKSLGEVETLELLLDLIFLEAVMTLIETHPSTVGARSCVIGRHLEELPEPYREALDRIVSSAMSAEDVAAAMTDSGLRGSASSVRYHRRNVCSCRTKGV